MQAGRKEHLVNFMISVVIFLITFPRFIPDYGTGLDPSYVWAFNYLANHDFKLLTQLTYPIGPFGFLKYAAAYQQNLIFSLAFFSIVKLSFIFLLLMLSQTNKSRLTVVRFLIVLFAASFAGIDFSIIGSTIILLILYARQKSIIYYFILAVLYALVGLFIKSSIGLASFSAIFSFLIFNLLSRNYSVMKTAALTILSGLMLFTAGIVLYSGTGYFFAFLNGLLHLAGGYSVGLALYPDNNWWLLSCFILTIIVSPFIFRNRKFQHAFWLLLLPLFAMWKHAMGREDSSHAQLLIGFLVMYWSILFFVVKKRKVLLIFLALLSVSFYELNLSHVQGYAGISPNLNGLTNFNEAVLHFTSFNSRYDSISRQNIRSNELDKSDLKLIGKSPVDVYPWDLSYIPANNFTWKPRKTIELGASTSAWLSHLAAENYLHSEAPQFVLFHLINDRWCGRFGSLDGRYILNDEPQVIYNLLNNFHLHSSTGKYLLLEKREEPIALNTNWSKTLTAAWNEWVAVPEAKEGVVRVAFSNDKTILGHIKTFFFKGEACFIDYKFEDGKVLSYRFLASNAEDGLWINPFMLRPDKSNREQEVIQIRFRNSDYRMVSENIVLNWQHLSFPDGENALSWFGKKSSTHDDVVLKLEEDFESRNANEKLSRDSYRGAFAEMIKASQFSTTFELELDTLWNNRLDEMTIQFEVFYKNVGPSDGRTALILTVENSADNAWLSFPLDGNGNPDEWKYACLTRTLFVEAHRGARIKAYVWNNGLEEVIIDDLKLSFIK